MSIASHIFPDIYNKKICIYSEKKRIAAYKHKKLCPLPAGSAAARNGCVLRGNVV